MGDIVVLIVVFVYGVVIFNVGENVVKVIDVIFQVVLDVFNVVVNIWFESCFKGYFDVCGVFVFQGFKIDEFCVFVCKYVYKVVIGWSVWIWDDLIFDNFKVYFVFFGDVVVKKVGEKVGVICEEFVQVVNVVYVFVFFVGGNFFVFVISYFFYVIDNVKVVIFDIWSESDFKVYLDSYGIFVFQGLIFNEICVFVCCQWIYYKYGILFFFEIIFVKIKENVLSGWDWVIGQVMVGFDVVKKKVEEGCVKVYKEF